MEKRITTPLTLEQVKDLKCGDSVLISGVIYTARDAAHKRLCELVAQGKELPFDPKDAVIYYVGPAPAKGDQVIGSAGPTTSYRMDAYSPTMIELGQRGMIGKGKRSPEVIEAMKKHGAVYFGAIGGAGALLSRCIQRRHAPHGAAQARCSQSASRRQSSSRMRISAPRHCASCM